MIEHLFVGEMLRYLWLSGFTNVDVLRAETDASGYDLVIEANSIIRHIQLKSSALTAKTSVQNIHEELWKKPSGCVIWIRFNQDSINLGPYRWYGARPGKPLTAKSRPDDFKIARHSKGNSKGEKTDRKNIRVLGIGQFDKVDTIAELASLLFGISARKT